MAAMTTLDLSVWSPSSARYGPLPPDRKRLAEALSAASGSSVPLLAGDWAELPAGGFVVVSLGLFPEGTLATGGAALERVFDRLVIVGLDRALLRDMATRLRPVAMIEEHAFETWQEGLKRTGTTPSGLIGRTGSVERYGIAWTLPETGYAMASALGWDLADLVVDHLSRMNSVESD